jgi:bifunctional UDP-N-acetylglucosamine pyrophosphorylase/glucosamine-1-phosphate N-acetyltransferase
LGLQIPKILLPIRDELNVWSILRDKLITNVNHIAVVLAPSAVPAFESVLDRESVSARAAVSVVVQERPTGMGDAIFLAWPVWRHFESILVVWGDQVNISDHTIHATLATHLVHQTGCTVPVVRIQDPYVQYDISPDGHLRDIRQKREGDELDVNGLSDVGIFALFTTGLNEAWHDYVLTCRKGALTNEVNFLPFLVFIAARGWPVRVVFARSAIETRGINTLSDLAFARRAFART